MNIESISLDKAKEGGKTVLLIATGLVAGHVINKQIIKKDTVVANALVGTACLLGASMTTNKTAKLLLIGGAVYGGMRALQKAAEVVLPPSNPNGGALFGDGMGGGFLPESVKEAIRKNFPSLGEVGEAEWQMNGEYAEMQGDEQFADFQDLTGQDDGMEGNEELVGDEDMQGIAGAEDLV